LLGACWAYCDGKRCQGSSEQQEISICRAYNHDDPPFGSRFFAAVGIDANPEKTMSWGIRYLISVRLLPLQRNQRRRLATRSATIGAFKDGQRG